jgi:hypothetical protein
MSQQRFAILFAGDVSNWQQAGDYITAMKETIKTTTSREVDIFCSCGADQESYDSFVAAMNPLDPAYIDYSQLPEIPGYPTPGPNDFSPELLGMIYHRKNVYSIMENYGIANNITYYNSIYWMTENSTENPFFLSWPIPLNNVYITQGNDMNGLSYRDAYGECGAMKTYSLLFDYFKEFSAKGDTDTLQHFLDEYIKMFGVNVVRY